MLGEKIEKKNQEGSILAKKMNPWMEPIFCNKGKAIGSKSADSLSTEKRRPVSISLIAFATT